MARYRCPRCHEQRSLSTFMLCSVCWMLDGLVHDHQQGEHDVRPTPSCELCKPAHAAQLEASGATAYARMLLSSQPLKVGQAKFLIRCRREGLGGIDRYGDKGRRVFELLSRQGHCAIERDANNQPYVWVSAKTLHDALEIVAAYEHVGDHPGVAQGRAQRAVSTSHASCSHERTPKARARCRAARA